MVVIIVLLLGGVVSRYVFSHPVDWIDEAVSIAFIWVAMIGAAIAMHRNEHLRLTLVLDMLPPARATSSMHSRSPRGRVPDRAHRAVNRAMRRGVVHHDADARHPEQLPRCRHRRSVSSLMLAIVLVYAVRTVSKPHLLAAAADRRLRSSPLCWWLSPQLSQLGLLNILIFLVALVAVCLAAGVPIAFCFGSAP